MIYGHYWADASLVWTSLVGTSRVFHSEAAKGRVGASEAGMEDGPLGRHDVDKQDTAGMEASVCLAVAGGR